MSDWVWPWMPMVALILLLLLWYLTYSATRLDRLHHRVEASRAALEAQLARRAATALEVAAVLDPATGMLVAGAAAEALADGTSRDGAGVIDEEVENDLSRVLHAAFDAPADVRLLREDPLVGDLLDVVAGSFSRAQMARRFHNDAVAQAQRVRRKRVVRWARLAGRAPMPQMVEIEDSTPAALVP